MIAREYNVPLPIPASFLVETPASVTIEFPNGWMKDAFVNWMLVNANDGFVDHILANEGIYLKLTLGDKTLKFVRVEITGPDVL